MGRACRFVCWFEIVLWLKWVIEGLCVMFEWLYVMDAQFWIVLWGWVFAADFVRVCRVILFGLGLVWLVFQRLCFSNGLG